MTRAGQLVGMRKSLLAIPSYYGDMNRPPLAHCHPPTKAPCVPSSLSSLQRIEMRAVLNDFRLGRRAKLLRESVLYDKLDNRRLSISMVYQAAYARAKTDLLLSLALIGGAQLHIWCVPDLIAAMMVSQDMDTLLRLDSVRIQVMIT